MKRLFLTLALVLSVLSVMAADILPISNAFKGGNASSLSGQGSRYGPTGFIQKVQRKRRCFNAEHLLRREQADRIYSRPPC